MREEQQGCHHQQERKLQIAGPPVWHARSRRRACRTDGRLLWTSKIVGAVGKENLRPPKRHQGAQGSRYVPNGNFAVSTQARPVAHAHLRDFVIKLTGARQHLGVDEEPGRLRQQVCESFFAEYLQSTVAIADPRTQQGAHQRVVAPGIEAPQWRVLAIEAITNNHGKPAGQGEQGTEVVEMELAIRVGKGNLVKGRRGESGAQGSAVAAIALMTN